MATSRKQFWLVIAGASAMCYPLFNHVLHPYFRRERSRPDRTVIVTGATGNLGKPIAFHLAKRDVRVIMACRDLDKCKSVRREIVLETGNKSVVCRHLDLESIDSINKFVDEVVKNEPHIDVLVNNAAIKRTEQKEITKYGLEKQLFVNFLGPYLLTFRLLDKLAEAAAITRDSRIINVVGTPKKNWNVNLEDINFDKRSYNSRVAYEQSKLALAYFTILLEKFNRERKNCIYVFGISPSEKRIAPSFNRPAGLLESLSAFKHEMFYHNPERIVQSVIKCALDPDVIRDGSGKLYNYLNNSVGFNGAWGVAAKDEVKAKLVWNKAAELMLKIRDKQ